jgi:histidine triad (HIT) family protein
MRETECVFCRIVRGEIPAFRILEDEHVLAFMDIHPGNEGHALVIPKTHAPDLFAVADADLARVAVAARQVASAVRDLLAPGGLNLVQANGPAAGQSVHHFHLHVLPRREGDDLRMNWGHRPGDRDAIAALGERLRARLAGG